MENMKRKTNIILFIISALLIILLVNPDILPLSGNTKIMMGELMKRHIFVSGGGKITLAHILTTVLALCIVIVVYLLFKFLLNILGSRSPQSQTFTSMIAAMLKYIAWIFAFVWVLGIFGVNTTAVLAGIGILGLVLGFGAQSLIEDIITGFFIIFEGQYVIGDIIILDDFRGTVRSIGVRTTVIEDAGGNLKVVNNSDIRNFQNRSRNSSLGLVIVSVAYDTDIPYMERVIAEALPKMYEAHKDIYLKAPQYLGVEKLADSGVDVKFSVPCAEQNVFIAQRQLNRDILVLFRNTGIEIPFPQVVVHKGE